MYKILLKGNFEDFNLLPTKNQSKLITLIQLASFIDFSQCDTNCNVASFFKVTSARLKMDAVILEEKNLEI